jgi:hypothetical protein
MAIRTGNTPLAVAANWNPAIVPGTSDLAALLDFVAFA